MSEVWSIGRRSDRQRRPGPSCSFCGCTEERACPGGCAWASPDVCTACLDLAEDLGVFAYRSRRVVRGQTLGLAILERLLRQHGAGIDRWPGRSVAKRPLPKMPVSPRKQGFKVSHTSPRRKGSDSRQGRR